MKDLLARAGLDVRDSSIRSENPNNATSSDYIKAEILAPALDWASVLVVLVTPETRHSEWVDWEIRYAHEHNTRIVGVWDHGEAECELPGALEDYGDAVVGWSSDSIIDAINGDDSWQDCHGVPRQRQAISHHNC